MACLVLKIKCIVFDSSFTGKIKIIRYIKLGGDKTFAVYFNDTYFKHVKIDIYNRGTLQNAYYTEYGVHSIYNLSRSFTVTSK